MDLISLIILVLSFFLFAQALFSLYLMLYTWEHPERMEASSGPSSFLPPRLSFTVLLPARHEEAVIFQTIKRVWAANYPPDLLEIVVICHAEDVGTVAEARRAIREIGSPRVRVETFSGEPINKPRGLNVGLERTGNEVVTIFDAEDDVDPDVFNVINTVMLEEEVGIVQAGVQLMNFRDHWFSVHNCLEYFFYYKSRLHFHAKVGMIPLGGNTVFFLRSLLERIGGWDESCLTEDADIGIRLSALGEPIGVVYNAQHVTREETPDSVSSFVKQRTRWSQGFLQILRKGTWLTLPRLGQKVLAFYTLSYSIFQGLVTVLWPLAIVAVFLIKVPTPVAIISFLPMYTLLLQLLISVVGAYVFAREYGLKSPLLMPMSMAISFVPFHILLGISAIRAVYREARNETNWEKTEHMGAHRRPEIAFPPEYELLLAEALGHLDAERGSVMVLNPERGTFSIEAGRGLPDEVVGAVEVDPGEGVVGWVAREKRPMIIGAGRAVPDELSEQLKQPGLRSSVVLPFEQSDGTVAVLNLSSTTREFAEDDLRWASARVSASPAVDAESSRREALFASEAVNSAQATIESTSSPSSSSYWKDRTQSPSTRTRPRRSDKSESRTRPSSNLGGPATSESPRRRHRRLRRRRARLGNWALGKWSVLLAPRRSDKSESRTRPSSNLGGPATSESPRRRHRRLRRRRARLGNWVLGKWSVLLTLPVLLCVGLFLILSTTGEDATLPAGGWQDAPEREVDQAPVGDVGKVAQDSPPNKETPTPGGPEAAILEVSESPSSDSFEPAWSETPTPETASQECGSAQTECLTELASGVVPTAEYAGGRMDTDVDGSGHQRKVLYFLASGMGPCEHVSVEGITNEAYQYEVITAGEAPC